MKKVFVSLMCVFGMWSVFVRGDEALAVVDQAAVIPVEEKVQVAQVSSEVAPVAVQETQVAEVSSDDAGELTTLEDVSEAFADVDLDDELEGDDALSRECFEEIRAAAEELFEEGETQAQLD